MKIFSLVTAFLFICFTAFTQEKLLTVAEKSDFRSTSGYRDVMSFIEQLKNTSPYIRVEKIAETIEGREIPLLVIGKPLPASPEDLRNDKRIIVYIQANIHAGEVEGKEASLMFARDLLSDRDPRLLDNIVILICPVFNADGNEKISTRNRTDQNGPVNGVGVRYNGQSLDLNRDAMKAESPEVRGVLRNVFNRWDPAVFMDCHTTDGSFHVEPVTFVWMVNPNGDKQLIEYMRDKMMPEISLTLSGKYKTENCFYGEFIDLLHPEKGWILDASEPRYMSNYYGLRNRLGILNENYVYAPFRDRVYGCYNLIKSLMDYASVHSAGIKEILKRSDERTVERGLNISGSDSFAVEYDVRPLAKKIRVRTYEAELVDTSNGWPQYRNTGRQVDVTVPYLIDYYPARSVSLPYAYILAVKDPAVTGLLALHGIRMEKLAEDTMLDVEVFIISNLAGSGRLNQGHRTNTVKGEAKMQTISFPAGTLIVRTAQPLANLAAYLLEPQSNDGLLTWNFLDKYLVPQWGPGYNPYPVYKLPVKTLLKLDQASIVRP